MNTCLFKYPGQATQPLLRSPRLFRKATRLFTVAALTVVGFVSDATAVDYYWRGNGGTDVWSNLGLWNTLSSGGGSTPGAFLSGDTFIENGVTGPMGTAYALNNNATVTFAGGTLVLGTDGQISVKATGTGRARITNLVTTGGGLIVAAGQDNIVHNLIVDSFTNQIGVTRLSASSSAVGRTLNLEIGTLSGAGNFAVDTNSAAGRTIFITVSNAVNYTGNFDFDRGLINFNNDLVSGGSLTLSGTAVVTLDQSVTFDAVTINGSSLAPGFHSFSSLNSTYNAFFTDGGSGGITVGSAGSGSETIGGGTVTSPAQGPAASYGLGDGAILVKNWNFGTNGTIKTKADLDAHFNYHDQFGLYINGGNKYGAQTVASNSATALSGQRIENVTAGPVREFFGDYLRTYLVPLDDATTVSATAHNVGCGSFVAKWELPRGGSLLKQDIIWETRVRYVTPRYFWFSIWIAGNIWQSPSGPGTGGAEIDLVESFGYDNGGGFTNFTGRYWHTASVGGLDDTSYSPGWNNGMTMRGITTYDATEYHTWTLVYRADDTFSSYVDGIEVQNGTINWTYGATETGSPIDMTFLFDGAWGHTQVTGVNKSMDATELSGKYYEWDYSRVYLRPTLKFQVEDVQTVAVSSGDSVTSLVDAGGSAGVVDRFDANGANDFVTYTLPSVPAGTYSTRVGVKTYSTRGIFQLSIDGVNQGGTHNLYANPGGTYYDAFVGSKTFGSTGNRAFKFTVTGKDSSSTDFDLGLDYIHLVELPPSGGTPTTVTMDSADSGKLTVVGKWITSKSTAGYFGPYYRNDSGEGKGTRSIRYTPALTGAGNYQVSIRYPAGTNRATNVPVDIVKSDGTISTVIVNQTLNSNVWISLGTYALTPGISSLTIRNTGTTAGQIVVADGVRFTPQ